MKKKRYTMKEDKFCKEFAKTDKVKDSVIEAGYAVSNDNSASALGSALLAKPHIQQKIDQYRSKIHETLDQELHARGGLAKAVQDAENDLNNEDPKVRSDARKFLLDAAKLADNNKNSAPPEHKHVHFNYPKR